MRLGDCLCVVMHGNKSGEMTTAVARPVRRCSSLMLRFGRISALLRTISGSTAALALATGNLAGCYAQNSYLLRIDAAQESRSELCVMKQAGAGGSLEEQSCEPLASQQLEAPGVLAVEVTNTSASKVYEVRLEETRRGAEGGPTPDEVIQEVSSRLTGLSAGFVGGLDKEPGVAREAGRQLLLSVSSAVGKDRPQLGAALEGVADGLKPKPAEASPDDGPATMQPWVDAATHSWKKGSDISAPVVLGEPNRRPPPRAVEYDAADFDYVAQRASEKDGQGKSIPDRLTGDAFALFTVEWCTPESFGKDPFTDQPWVTEPAPWTDPQDLLKKLALDAPKIARLVSTGGFDITEHIKNLRKEIVAAKPGSRPSEPALVLNYLLNVSRIAHDLDRCEHNLGSLPPASEAVARQVAVTLAAVKATRLRLESTMTAQSVFQHAIAPIAVRAAVKELMSSGNGGTLAFGTYTLRAGTLSVSATSAEADAEPKAVTKLEFPVRNVGPVSVSVGPFVSLCSECIHSVKERYDVVDADGTPSVRRMISDEPGSRSIGYAAMLHYSLLGGTRHQGGVALGYPLRDQTGTALGVLAGVGYRNTVGIQLSTGVHVFQTQKATVNLPVDVSAATTAGVTPDDVTDGSISAAWFLFIGATSDLLMKQ
jgi:hypothetical protein